MLGALIPSLHLFGPVYIHPFGFFVACGIFLGARFIGMRGRKLGLPEKHLNGLIIATLAGGFIGGHICEIVFYQAARLDREGWILLFKIWDGLSSFGGFIGAVIGIIIYWRVKIGKDLSIYADLIIQGLIIGWIFGRIGCTVAFDHPGELSNFFLAMKYSDGLRHNLGFYEFLLTLLVLLPASFLISYFKLRAGCQTAIISILYAPARFFMDFLRVGHPTPETRFWGLTFAQYCCIILFLIGCIQLIWIYRIRPAAGPLPPSTLPKNIRSNKR